MSLHQPSERWKLGLGLALVTTTFWGCLPVVLSLLLKQTDPITLMAVRFLVAGAFTAALLARAGRLPKLAALPRGAKLLLPVAVLGLAGNYYFFQLGIQHTTPATAQLVIQLAPIMFMGASVLVFKERMHLAQGFGVLVVVTGLLLFFHHKISAATGASDAFLKGVLAIFAAGVVWTCYALAQKQLLQQLSSQGIMLVVYLASAALSLPFSDFDSIMNLNALGVGLLVFASVNTIIAYGAFSEALAHWSASRVSAVLSITPILTLATSTAAHSLFPELVSSDAIPAVGFVGAAMVVAGSMAASLSGRHSRK